MKDPDPLSRALDEAVAAVADAIEVHYRSAVPNGNSSIEVREALSRAMRWVSEASRLEFESRTTRQQTAAGAAPLPSVRQAAEPPRLPVARLGTPPATPASQAV